MMYAAPGLSPAALEWSRYLVRQQAAQHSQDPDDVAAARAAMLRFQAAFRGQFGDVQAPGGAA